MTTSTLKLTPFVTFCDVALANEAGLTMGPNTLLEARQAATKAVNEFVQVTLGFDSVADLPTEWLALIEAGHLLAQLEGFADPAANEREEGPTEPFTWLDRRKPEADPKADTLKSHLPRGSFVWDRYFNQVFGPYETMEEITSTFPHFEGSPHQVLFSS